MPDLVDADLEYGDVTVDGDDGGRGVFVEVASSKEIVDTWGVIARGTSTGIVATFEGVPRAWSAIQSQSEDELVTGFKGGGRNDIVKSPVSEGFEGISEFDVGTWLSSIVVPRGPCSAPTPAGGTTSLSADEVVAVVASNFATPPHETGRLMVSVDFP